MTKKDRDREEHNGATKALIAALVVLVFACGTLLSAPRRSRQPLFGGGVPPRDILFGLMKKSIANTRCQPCTAHVKKGGAPRFPGYRRLQISCRCFPPSQSSVRCRTLHQMLSFLSCFIHTSQSNRIQGLVLQHHSSAECATEAGGIFKCVRAMSTSIGIAKTYTTLSFSPPLFIEHMKVPFT